MIVKLFNKKSNFIKKVNFSIDNDLQYFPPKNHFLYWKNGFQKKLDVKKKFSQQHESVSRSTPLSCCWENVKKCQNFTHGYFDKNSKNTIINRETVFRKTTLSIEKSPKICRSFKGYDDYNSIALQVVDIDKLEG